MKKRRGETRQDTAARVRVSLADRLTVALDGALGAAARDELDPCPPADANAPVDIEVVHGGFPRCGDADEVAGDGGDGWLSSYRADGLHLARHAPGACVVTGRPGDLPLRVISDGELQSSTGWQLHQLRHSAATHLGEKSVPLQLIMAKTRHKSPRSCIPTPRSDLTPVPKAARLSGIS